MGSEAGDAGFDLPDTDPADLIGAVSFDSLSPTDFEEFCFDLLVAAGFTNVDWRKGTPKSGSPSDQGRDIVAERAVTDPDGHSYTETWFVECKHYKQAVPPNAIESAAAWASAERPSVLLYIVSGFLSNGAKNWIESYQRNNRPSFRIRTWELPQLRNIIARHQDVAWNHDVQLSTLRRVSDIIAKENELFDRLWYGRKMPPDHPSWEGVPDDIKQGAEAHKRVVEERIGKDVLDQDVSTDFNWGLLTGSIVAVRWVLGDEWGNADS